MFFESLADLKADDVRRITAAGIPPSRISEWRKGKRLPTRPQTLAYCTVMGLDFDLVNREITEIEAKEDAKNNSLMAAVFRTLKPAWHFT
ncbi:MAG: helix-turn-helix transcriptional regulator [Proteobacteria bacterium]|nr:helix-turn-helix transcriptional regulator [Pseudomonadota bacterium]